MMSEKASSGGSNTIFLKSSNGVKTNRDIWVYNFNQEALTSNIQQTLEAFNETVDRIKRLPRRSNIDSFIVYDDKRLSWSETLRGHLQKGKNIDFEPANTRKALYRPYSKKHLYFDKHLIDRRLQFPTIFPTVSSEHENLVMSVSATGSEKPFMVLCSNCITDLHVVSGGSSSQCFPFYIYDEDGSNRRENITDWALDEYRTHYKDAKISKWDIFYYVYALLHYPTYRERYAANLKRELPRIPFAPKFWEFAEAGKKLATLHVEYEKQKEYPLEREESKSAKLNFRVEKMKLSKDKRTLIYNDYFTLNGIPKESFEYRLGNRSALEWVIDQYQISTDKRSGITNDPNRSEDKEYILRLIGQVITVSVETVKIVNGLPEFAIGK